MNFNLVLLLTLFISVAQTSDLQDIINMKKVKDIVKETERLLKDKKYDKAQKLVDDGLKIDSKSFDLHVLIGKIHYYKGDQLQAKKSFEYALSLKPGDSYATKWISKLNIQDGKQKTQHFIFYKVPDSRKWVYKMPLEKGFEKISNYLDTTIFKPIELWFFEDEESFFKVYGAQHSYKKGKLLGVSQYEKNRILLSSRITEKDMLSVILHELVHFFLHLKMKNSKLYGLEEGLANFLGNRKANYNALKKTELFDKKQLNISFEDYIFYRLNGVHDYKHKTIFYYEISTALIEYIDGKFGHVVLKRFINDLMRTDTNYYRLLWASLAFESKEDFEKSFYTFIREKMNL